MTFSRLVAQICACALVAAACPGVAMAAAAHTTAYVQHDDATPNAWLVDFQDHHRAHVTTWYGAADGTVSNDVATGRQTITFDAPFSHMETTLDCTGLVSEAQRFDVTAIAITPVSGTSRRGKATLSQVGQVTDLGGCTPGHVGPLGALTDPGTATDFVDMAARPSMSDLGSGAQIAGYSETQTGDILSSGAPVNVYGLEQDLVTFGFNSVTFQATQRVIGLVQDYGWHVFSLYESESYWEDRAYTRLIQRLDGGEVWLGAYWVNNVPMRVWRTLMVKPRAGAGFGDTTGAAHRWLDGIYLDSPWRQTWDLAADQTGTRTYDDSRGGTSHTVMPVTWQLDGNDLRLDYSTTVPIVRTWTPVANVGTRVHWVLERATNMSNGVPQVAVPRHVVNYLDKGPTAQ